MWENCSLFPAESKARADPPLPSLENCCAGACFHCWLMYWELPLLFHLTFKCMQKSHFKITIFWCHPFFFCTMIYQHREYFLLPSKYISTILSISVTSNRMERRRSCPKLLHTVPFSQPLILGLWHWFSFFSVFYL